MQYVINSYSQTLPSGDVNIELLAIDTTLGINTAISVPPATDEALSALAKQNGNSNWGNQELQQYVQQERGLSTSFPS